MAIDMNKNIKNQIQSRRAFIRQAGWAAVLCPVALMFLRSTPALALVKKKKKKPEAAPAETSKGPEPLPAGETAVAMDDPIASALSYDPEGKKEKKKEDKDHFCHNCEHYQTKNKGWGSCNFFATGVVTAGGWCKSWSKAEGK